MPAVLVPAAKVIRAPDRPHWWAFQPFQAIHDFPMRRENAVLEATGPQEPCGEEARHDGEQGHGSDAHPTLGPGQ